jgi:hypothetical protein
MREKDKTLKNRGLSSTISRRKERAVLRRGGPPNHRLQRDRDPRAVLDERERTQLGRGG